MNEMLKEKLEKYIPFNEQEEKDKAVMISYLKNFDNSLTRENKYGHFTSSAWVVNKERTKVLMIYHNIYNSWAWPGGHADGEEDLLAVAIREVEEETGVKKVKVVTEDIFSLEIITVDGHVKRGEYVPSHTHLNAAFLLEVDESEVLKIKEDENSGVKWIPLEEVEKEATEKWVVENVYKKIIKKLK
ncbi:MAG: NUDIX hydrolase [Clostridia bacterium]|nr:NUDIX hydrolase [Clostridia bacterium]